VVIWPGASAASAAKTRRRNVDVATTATASGGIVPLAK